MRISSRYDQKWRISYQEALVLRRRFVRFCRTTLRPLSHHPPSVVAPPSVRRLQPLPAGIYQNATMAVSVPVHGAGAGVAGAAAAYQTVHLVPQQPPLGGASLPHASAGLAPPQPQQLMSPASLSPRPRSTGEEVGGGGRGRAVTLRKSCVPMSAKKAACNFNYACSRKMP